MPRINFQYSQPPPENMLILPDPVICQSRGGDARYRYVPENFDELPADVQNMGGIKLLEQELMFVQVEDDDGYGGQEEYAYGWVVSQSSTSARRLGIAGAFVCWSIDVGWLLELSNDWLRNPTIAVTDDWLPTEWPSLLLDGERAPRLISAEQELAHGRATADYYLQRQGFFYRSRDYAGHIPQDDGHGLKIGYAMSDSSCDGELVFSKLNLTDQAHAERYGHAAALVQKLAERKETSVHFNCGHHIHVSGTDMEGSVLRPNALRRLYAIIGHIEPVLFRLGEGGLGRHRGGHRTAHPVPKIETPITAMAINHSFNVDDNSHYNSINLQPFLQAVNSCRCGALLWGKWKGCTCGAVQNGGTIEFRIWNGVTRPDYIHAYLALSAAIVELSVTGRGLFSLPETEWSPGTLTGGIATGREKDAYKWLVNSLRLSETERTQIELLAAKTTLAAAVSDGLPPLPEQWRNYVAELKDQSSYMHSRR